MQMNSVLAIAVLAFTSSAAAFYEYDDYSIYAREAEPEYEFDDLYVRDAEAEVDFLHPRDAYDMGFEEGLYARSELSQLGHNEMQGQHLNSEVKGDKAKLQKEEKALKGAEGKRQKNNKQIHHEEHQLSHKGKSGKHGKSSKGGKKSKHSGHSSHGGAKQGGAKH